MEWPAHDHHTNIHFFRCHIYFCIRQNETYLSYCTPGFMRSCYGYEQLCYPIDFTNLLSSWTDIPQMTSISSHRRLPLQRRQNLELKLNIVSYSNGQEISQERFNLMMIILN